MTEESVSLLTLSTYYGYGYRQGISDVIHKIKAEIEEKYGDCDICEWQEDEGEEDYYCRGDYYPVGAVKDILEIIDKYRNFCYNKGEDKEKKGEDEE